VTILTPVTGEPGITSEVMEASSNSDVETFIGSPLKKRLGGATWGDIVLLNRLEPGRFSP
jgi:hypothetical protein